MRGARFRPFDSVLLAIMTAVVLALPPGLYRLAKLSLQVELAANEGWIMSGTGQPDPTVGSYINDVLRLYLQPEPPLFPGQSTFPGYHFQGLTTPEQFCPFVCLPPPNPPLTFGDSLRQGVADLNNAITPQLTAGDHVVVFGYSQSATIATLEMQNLISHPPGGVYDPANLHVVLIGDPNNPIGGMLARFDFGGDQHVPFVNIPLGIGPTPTGEFPTDIYTGDYDGWANFPRDPTNILADINALIGIATVHGYYPDPTAGVNLDVGDITDLGTIGNTTFHSIFAPMPILAFMYDGGPAGRFFYDAFSPLLGLIVNWGYGNPGNPGDPGAGFAVDGVDPIGVAGPWQVDATGQLVESGAIGLLLKMDPLQMLAGLQYAGVQSLVGPIDELLGLAGQAPLPDAVTQGLLAGYNLTNGLDSLLLNGWNGLAGGLGLGDVLGPDAILDGAPLISGQPLLGLVGLGFDAFNVFGA